MDTGMTVILIYMAYSYQEHRNFPFLKLEDAIDFLEDYVEADVLQSKYESMSPGDDIVFCDNDENEEVEYIHFSVNYL